MKVALEIIVNVNAAAWMTEYAVAPEDLRKDVKDHCEHLLLGTLSDMGLLNP